jgi:integrase
VAESEKSAASKFSRDYWAQRIFKETYPGPDGKRIECQEWTARIMHAGERRRVTLGTNSKQEAAAKAAAIFKAVRSKGWDTGLAETLPGHAERRQAGTAPTVGEFITAALAAADASPRSLRNYAVCMRKIVGDAFNIKGDARRYDYRHGGRSAYVEKIDAIKLDKLTPALVQAALNARIAAARGNPLAEQRSRMTAASTLRQAKALFSPDVKVPFAPLPNPFLGVKIKVGTPRKYASTIDAAALLRAGRDELAESDPEAYKALLLALGAGLRKSEIDNLQWQQIDSAAGIIRIQTTATFHAKTDSSEGDVFVDPGLIAALDAYRSKATSLYVLESPLPAKPESRVAYYRAAASFNRLQPWLRKHGVLARKPLHELRKEFGSVVASAGGIHVASRQLRHASISTTAAFYADHRNRVAVPVGAMLAAQPASKKDAIQ